MPDRVLAAGLKMEQQAALEMLELGKSVAEAARSAGVGRTTIYRWLKGDAAFQAAYNQWHEELAESCRSRLMAMTEMAADALQKALAGGDAKAAMQLLKGLGLIGPPEKGETDVAVLRKRAELESKRRQIAIEREEGKLELDRELARVGG